MKKRLLTVLLTVALLLCGCGSPDAPAPATDAPALPTEAPAGPAAEAVRRLLAPYRQTLERAGSQSGGYAALTVPAEILEQMSRDAQAADAKPQDGRWHFTVRQTGSHSYEATAMDAYAGDMAQLTATPAPGDETPQDHQLMGDYVAVGGGDFTRVRQYDAAEDLSAGRAEWTDTLNGETTGHEVFSFALRDGRLYFVDAAMDMTAGLDGLENRGMRLVALGWLDEDGLDVMEYAASGEDALPDPADPGFAAAMDAAQPLTRVTDRNGKVTVFP